MYSSRREVLQDDRIHRFDIFGDGDPLSYADALDRWRRDASFRSFFLELLREATFSAYRWETPPVTTDTLGQPFEFALVDDHRLDMRPDPSPFASHFTGADAEVVVFENLGGDAELVAPCPHGPESAYGHLAAFARGAPAWQNHALWQTVAEAMEERTGDRPIWLSTAGGGVAWLHVRLDTRPKYYRYSPYVEFA